MRNVILAFIAVLSLGAGVARAQARHRASPEPAAAATPITDADIKSTPTPKPEDRAKGDPAGTLTGTAADIPLSDPKKGLTIQDVVSPWARIDRDQLHLDAGHAASSSCSCRPASRSSRPVCAAPRTPTTP